MNSTYSDSYTQDVIPTAGHDVIQRDLQATGVEHSYPVSDSPNNAWHLRADELAEWAMQYLVVRTDRYGGYYRRNGKKCQTARPNGYNGELLSDAVLRRHFSANHMEDVIGVYPLRRDDSMGRCVVIDIDAHDRDDDPDRNARYAEHLDAKLRRLGFRPLLATWGTGGYHLWVIFDEMVPGATLHGFSKWVVSDAPSHGYTKPIESFPKQGVLTELAPYGNWVRLLGRHHTHDTFAAVYDGTKWLRDAEAVNYLLLTSGDSMSKIPPEVLPVPASPVEPSEPSDFGDDVITKFSAETTIDTVVGWHTEREHKVVNRSLDRFDFCRGGKNDGVSFNVTNCDGIAITYNFSANSGLPDAKGLTPAQVYCLYRWGSCEPETMCKLAKHVRAGKIAGNPPRIPAGRPTDAIPGSAQNTKLIDRHGNVAGTPFAYAWQFAKRYRERACYVIDWNTWMIFDGRRWVRDASGAHVEKLAMCMYQQLGKQANRTSRTAKNVVRDLGRLQRSGPVGEIIKLAKRYLQVDRGADRFDQHPDLLNCENVTVNLRTGEKREFRANDYLTRIAPTRYNPEAQSDRYLEFLRSVLPDNENVEYLQKLSGYVITGETSAQILHTFYGGGSNGKSLLLDIWRAVLGEEYAVTAPSALLTDSDGNRHPTEMTILRGARLAVCEETSATEKLNAKRIKLLVGTKSITARGMRQDFFTFHATHKLILATNHRPKMAEQDQDHSMWRRNCLLPFPHTFWTESDRMMDPAGHYPPDRKADPHLCSQLLSGKEGILADMVRHATIYYASSSELTPPASLVETQVSYRDDEDVIGRYQREHLEAAQGKWIPARSVYQSLRRWYCDLIDATGQHCPSEQTFGARMKHKFQWRRTRGGVQYEVHLIDGPIESVSVPPPSGS